MKRTIAGVLALCSVILYATGYWICEFFFMDDIVKWRLLRDLLTGVVIFALVIVNFLPRTRLVTASLWAFGIFCFGNLVDRLVFGISTFVGYDYLVIALAIFIFIKKIIRHDVQSTGGRLANHN